MCDRNVTYDVADRIGFREDNLKLVLNKYKEKAKEIAEELKNPDSNN